MRTTTRTLTTLAVLSLLAACVSPTSGEDASSAESPLTLGAPIGTIGSIGTISVGGSSLSDRAYYFQGLGSRCFDFGAQASWAVGGAVILYSCNGSVAQQVRVRELDADSHDVELRVQSLYCLGVRGGAVTVGQPLELQTCNGSPAQRFALDGDSVLMGFQTSGRVTRDVVIEPQNDATVNRTPLVVGTRDTSDAEYFRAAAVDGTANAPTSGFVKVSSETVLRQQHLAWGSVVEIDDSVTFNLAAPLWIPDGVTLRGYRKHREVGPTITFSGTDDYAIVVNADHVRITGLRMVGTAGNKAGGLNLISDAQQRVLVDHLEVTRWTGAAVNIFGGDAPCGNASDPPSCDSDASPEHKCPDPSAYLSGPYVAPRPTNVRLVHDFVHDNTSYGIVTGHGAMILAQGNVEYNNQHSVSSDPVRYSGYVAYDNLILSPTPGSDHSSNQDFDAHGSLHPGHWYEGIAGDSFDIGWNTFLENQHYNFNLRGTPCRGAAFHDNVSVESQGDALTSQSTTPFPPATNAYSVTNPMGDVAVGDFDGDHVDDIFVGTGATWWFSSAGQSEWRQLNRMPEHASQLRFGDFDGDGRTDVLAAHNGDIDISWGGISPWQTVNVFGWALSDLAVGDFDGDRISDLFLSTGKQWFYAPGARNWAVWTIPTTMAYLTRDLRFGDFNADGKTDVFGVIGNQWEMVPAGGTAWQPLRTALTTSVIGLVTADFDGDGFADVLRTSGSTWQYAARGWGGFVTLRSGDGTDVSKQPIGHFDLDAKADVMEWSGDRFAFSSAAKTALATVSLQSMK